MDRPLKLDWFCHSPLHATAHPGYGLHYEVRGYPGEDRHWEAFVWQASLPGEKLTEFAWTGNVDDMFAMATKVAEADFDSRISKVGTGATVLHSSLMPAPDALVRMHDGQVMPTMFWFAIEDSDLDEIASEHGFETGYRDLFGSQDTEEADEALEAAYERNPIATLEDWQPEAPEGWQFGGKWHTEDGATACFLRKREIAL